MKAVRIDDYGTNEVVNVVDIAIPEPQADEVLVRISTAGVNPFDWKIRGGVGKRIGLTLPIVLGGELVGTIEKTGTAVSHLKVGDTVYGLVTTGAFAEYAVAKASSVVIKPKNLDDVHAAAVPLAGLTAWQSLFDLANLTAGQKILINGASGAVGSLAVQFAKAKGAYVIGTGSGKNKDFVVSLGADQFCDYETDHFADRLKDMDVVFDTVGGDSFEKLFKTLKTNGVIVTAVAFPTEEQMRKYGVEAKRVYCKPNAQQLNEIGHLFDAGKLKIRVSKILPLTGVKEAFDLSESGKANGKIVLQVATNT